MRPNLGGALRPKQVGLASAPAVPTPTALRRHWPPRALGPRRPVAASSRGQALRSPELARLEAVLLALREPASVRKLAQLAGLPDGTAARTLLVRLNALYDRQGQAFRVSEVAGGYQLMTRAKFGKWLRWLHPLALSNRLSAPALETLAVVAYRQPVVRADIEAIRGVQCGEILRQLMERELIRIVGRSEELGRPFLYGTTRRFLQQFGLRRLDDLPRAEWLRATAAATTQDNAALPVDRAPGIAHHTDPDTKSPSRSLQ